MPYGLSLNRSIKQHLLVYYQIKVKIKKSKTQVATGKQLKVLYQQAQANDDVNNFNLEILKSYLNKLIIAKALITLIVVYNLSYCLAK